MDEVIKRIIKTASFGYDKEAIRDGLGWLVEHYDKVASDELRKYCVAALKNGKDQEYFELYKLGLLVSAPHEFDCFMQYLEIDRPASERFYLPRRKHLRRYVESLQDLSDGVIDELFISSPPRIGKTSLVMFFMLWRIGKDTERSNLYCSYSDIITKAFYNGILEVMTDIDTYNYRKVFPKAQIVRTNAQDETIDLERKKRYASLTCRSLYGTLNGAVDVDGLLVSDDLIGGIEEAMNKDRMVNAWLKVDNNMLPRAKQGAKILWIGTRWSVIDPAGIRQDLLLNDEQFKTHKWRVINVPALNDEDESNFDYKYGVGFSTKYYKERRASFERNNDMASWLAQYQGVPIEREGAVFAPDDLMYYNGELPDKEPDRVFMAVDPAWGGGDFVAAPIVYQYGKELYVADVVYSNADKSKTIPMLARKVRQHKITSAYIEASKTTRSFAEELDKLLKSENIRINIQTSMKNAVGKNKEYRIHEAAPDIRENMVFLESGRRTKDYELFMQNVYSFKVIGKNKNDDAPDSLQMAITYAFPRFDNKIVVKARPF